MEQPNWIDTRERLAAAAADLARHPVLGVDTESNSFFAYRERVCLLQISTPRSDYLVDTLVFENLAPLAPVFSNPGILKVFHDGEQDLQALRRDFDLPVRGLFDTKVVAAALGEIGVGLAALVQRQFGVELDKRFQRSNWARRPLSPEQLDYARADTCYLIGIHAELSARLSRAEAWRGRLAASEFARLEALEPVRRAADPAAFRRVKGGRNLGPAALRALAELFGAREEEARKADVPPVKILADPVLLALATLPAPPEGEGDLEKLAGLPRRSLRRHGEWVLRALRRAAALGPMRIPERHDAEALSEASLDALERLRRWRREVSAAREVDPSLLLNRMVMEEIARRLPASLDALGAVPGLEAWRVEAWGAEILAALRADGASRRRPWLRCRNKPRKEDDR